MEQDLNKLSREELVALLQRSRGSSSASTTVQKARDLVGKTTRLILDGIEIPIKIKAFQLDKRSASFLFMIEDTIFNLEHGRRDVSTLVKEVKDQDILKELQEIEVIKLATKKLMADEKLDFEAAISKAESKPTNKK